MLLKAIEDLDIALAQEKKSNRKIEELLRRKEGFLHCLSHDVMTPLTPLLGLLPVAINREKNNSSKQIDIEKTIYHI